MLRNQANSFSGVQINMSLGTLLWNRNGYCNKSVSAHMMYTFAELANEHSFIEQEHIILYGSMWKYRVCRIFATPKHKVPAVIIKWILLPTIGT